MRKILLSLCVLGSIQPSAHAQLLNTQGVLNQINTVNRQVEMTAEQIQRKTERDLQQLKPAINNTVDRLAKTTDQLIDPLLKLPQQLPILNRSGQTVFIEVEVENGWRAVQQEWLIMLNENELATLQQLPINIIEKTRFAELDMTLVRFRVPAEMDSLSALKKQLPPELMTRLDRNHVYTTQLSTTSAPDNNLSSDAICQQPVKVGMIDTAIKIDHPAFASAKALNHILTRNFLTEKLAEPEAHGTAVAGLLIGNANELKPLLPNAILYSASVFYARNDYVQGATMMNLVRALNWLLEENVGVINMSLAGPDNQILAAAVAKIIGSGKAIVAAAGNEGPAAPPMYPAAYPNVIAVTAVDHERKNYRWANRGSYIYFSAPGVSVITARTDGSVGRESGTSIAAPVVSAFLSCELQKNTRTDSLKILQTRAIDLGEPGRDPIFGFGLLAPATKSGL